MFLTPPEIQHQTLKTHRGGYDREEVDNLLEHVASSYEQVWLERDELRSHVAQLEGELGSFRESERYLRDTLVIAQRAAEDLRSEAKRDAERVLAEALSDVGRGKAEAERELQDLRAEIERLGRVERDVRTHVRALLNAGLQLIEDGGATAGPPARTLVDALSSEAARVDPHDG